MKVFSLKDAKKDAKLNRLEVSQFLDRFFHALGSSGNARPAEKLKPFLDLVLSLKKELPMSIPILRDLSGILTGRAEGKAEEMPGTIARRINRRYLRLCRMQEELGRLNLKKAPSGVSPEDFIFSQIDFSRYRKMSEADFSLHFPEGLDDFSEDFFCRNFGPGRDEISSIIRKCYTKVDGFRVLEKESPLILSIMRTLETSAESLPLFTAGEISNETKNLLDYLSIARKIPGTEKLFPLLAYSLDGAIITHEDGMATRLFISPDGSLSGTFRPGNKPWTCELIPANLLAK